MPRPPRPRCAVALALAGVAALALACSTRSALRHPQPYLRLVRPAWSERLGSQARQAGRAFEAVPVARWQRRP